jgi:hypothetical protein
VSVGERRLLVSVGEEDLRVRVQSHRLARSE